MNRGNLMIFKYICKIYLNIFCQMANLNLLSLENNILTLWKDQLHPVNSKEKKIIFIIANITHICMKLNGIVLSIFHLKYT